VANQDRGVAADAEATGRPSVMGLLRRLRPDSWPARLVATGLLTLLVLAILVPLLAVGAFERARAGALDRFYPAGIASDRVVVVEINVEAMDRTDHAHLIRILHDAGSAAVLYDVVFDRPSPDPAVDADLAMALRDAGNVVIATASVLVPGERILEVREAQPPIELLAEAARGLGHAGIWIDDDGVARAMPIAVDDGRRFIPSLASATVAVADGADPELVTIRPFGVEVGGRLHPSPDGELGLMTISWAPALDWHDEDRPALKAAQLLAGEIAPDLQDKIVLVGDTTDVLGGDFHLMPVSKAGGGMPGVWAQANAVNTMLTSQYRTAPPDWGTLSLIALLAAVGALVSVSVGVILWIGPAVVAIEAAFLLLLDLRFQNGTDLDVVYPSIGLGLATFAAVGLRYVTELREKRRVASLFGNYIPPEVARELVDSGRLQAVSAGERLEISTFFADLRGFTATAATLEPLQVREMLDVFYKHLTESILEHGGTVMQYVGDEVFAIFGAPVRHPDHVQRAVDCAIAVRDRVDDLNAELAGLGLPSVQYGIGVNTGDVVAAHVGTHHRQYSVIGDPVNVGSRLCALAKAGHVTFPEEVRVRLERVPDIEPYGPVFMKGVARDVDVHLARKPGSEPASYEKVVKAGPAPR